MIDIEAGIYSYTVADKLIMEAEEKPNKRLRKLRRNKRGREEKLEEQQNKLEEGKEKAGGRGQSKPNDPTFIASLGLAFLL